MIIDSIKLETLLQDNGSLGQDRPSQVFLVKPTPELPDQSRLVAKIYGAAGYCVKNKIEDTLKKRWNEEFSPYFVGSGWPWYEFWREDINIYDAVVDVSSLEAGHGLSPDVLQFAREMQGLGSEVQQKMVKLKTSVRTGPY